MVAHEEIRNRRLVVSSETFSSLKNASSDTARVKCSYDDLEILVQSGAITCTILLA